MIPYYATNLGGYRETVIAKLVNQTFAPSNDDRFLLSNSEISLPATRTPLFVVRKSQTPRYRLDCAAYLPAPSKIAQREGDYACVGVSLIACSASTVEIFAFLSKAAEMVSRGMQLGRFYHDKFDWGALVKEWGACQSSKRSIKGNAVSFAFKEKVLGIVSIEEGNTAAFMASIIDTISVIDRITIYIASSRELEAAIRNKGQVKIITERELSESVEMSLDPKFDAPAYGRPSDRSRETTMIGNPGNAFRDSAAMNARIDNAEKQVRRLSAHYTMLRRLSITNLVACVVIFLSMISVYMVGNNRFLTALESLRDRIEKVEKSGAQGKNDKGGGKDKLADTNFSTENPKAKSGAESAQIDQTKKTISLNEEDAANLRKNISDIGQLIDKCKANASTSCGSQFLSKIEELQRKSRDLIERQPTSPAAGSHENAEGATPIRQ